MLNIIIKSETPDDYEAIYEIHKLAFGQNNEAELISDLRKTSCFDEHLSLIAFTGSKPVGHILFYPLNIKTDNGLVPTLGLVPLAVKPEFQKMGVGSKLVEEGLKRAKELGYKSAVVEGSPDYYGKFKFKLVDDIGNNIGEPIDHFMYIELEPNSLKDIHGIIEYPEEFKNL